MLSKIKEHLEEVIALSEGCPEKYQLKCFEVLLESLTRPQTTPSTGTSAPDLMPSTPQTHSLPNVLSEISDDEITSVYHKEGNKYDLIVGDLKVKPISQMQVRLALLLGMKNLMETGTDATLSRDMLVDICKYYGAHDSANFATNMKKNRQYFLPKGKDWALTVPGQKKAAELIKELAQ